MLRSDLLEVGRLGDLLDVACLEEGRTPLVFRRDLVTLVPQQGGGGGLGPLHEVQGLKFLMGVGQMEPRLVALCPEVFEMLAAGQAARLGGLQGFGKPLLHDLPRWLPVRVESGAPVAVALVEAGLAGGMLVEGAWYGEPCWCVVSP